MFDIFRCYEPFESIKITFFNGFIAQYFVSFFIDHTVAYNLQDNVWSEGPKMLFARQRAASLVWNGMIWMLGGREGSKILQHNEVMMYPGIYNGTNHKSWKWMNKVFISY